MKRKLVKQGAATMMISLPSKWVRENKLEKGDELDVLDKEGNLVIGRSVKDKGEIVIEINESNRKDIINVISHVYRKGFDRIVLKGIDKKTIREVRLATEKILLGFEITEKSGHRVIIENISEPTGQRYDVMLRKIFQVIEETQEIVIEDFEMNKLDNSQDISDLRDQQDRFVFFCRRLLAKENTQKDRMLHWELLTFLMHIGHRYTYLYYYAARNKMQKNKEVVELLKETKNYFKLYSDAYYNQDINSIHKINNLKKRFYFGKCLTLLENSKGKNTVVLAYIREIFRIIQIGTSPILTEILEKNFDSIN